MEMGGVWDTFENAIMELAMTIGQCDSTFSVKLVLSPSDSERLVRKKKQIWRKRCGGTLENAIMELAGRHRPPTGLPPHPP